MAGKRHLEDLDPLTYKLPRLETEPSCVLPTGLCKSSSLPSNGSENHFSYKGTYFSYPLQSPEGNESLMHWSPAAPYLQYPGTAVSQHMRTDGALMNCLLYGRGTESLGVRLRHSGADKGKDSMVQDLLIVQENAQAPPGRTTLAVPKPVYRNPLCYVDPRTSVSLQPPMESTQKRPLEVEWTVPTPVSSGHHIHPKDQHCGTAAPKRAHHPDASLLQLHQRAGLHAKETVAAPVGFPPYHAAFEKYRAHPGTSFLEANYPAMYSSQKRVTDVSPWSKLQPAAASPLAHSQAAAYRERSPACYSVSHYPLTAHKQMLLCPEAPRAEEQNSTLSTLPAAGGYKGSNFPGSGELRSFPSTYLRHHSPRGYYASPLESYVYSPAGPIPGASPALNPGVLSREPELRQNSICKADYLQQNPSLVFAPSDMALYNASLASMDAAHDRHISSPGTLSHGTQPVRESTRNKQTEHPSLHGKEQPHLERRSSLSMKEPTDRNAGIHKAPLGAPIVITDSPVLHNHHHRKEPSKERLKSLKDAENSLPSSPPMPVINNVFSLAPYRDYIEGSKESAEIPFSKGHREKESPLGKSLGSGDCKAVSEPLSAKDSTGHPNGKEETQPLKAEMGMGENLPATQREGSCYNKTCESYKPKIPPYSLPARKQGVCERSKPQTLPLPRDQSNFQSSAAFMFKKYKILKSSSAYAVPPVQTNSSPSAMQVTPAAAQTNSPPAVTMQGPQANTQPLQMTCLYLKLPDISKPLPPSAPEASPALGEANVSLPSNCESPAQQTSSGQYFTALHVSLCSRISYFVSGTSLELLKQWLRRVELDGEQKWLGFKDISVLLSKLLSQLETFMFTRKCPFPHVVRAGAIFIPIHVVKEKLFPKLSGASVDHVLQEHKVELRPTTLSEEKLLRDLELKCCTSRMLKLLALKQLPDIYPDLLNLHWHDCVKQQLG
uniref:Chromosome 15 open reading frame 39 n=1 Tax=Pelodiscus sinensis TaxID=13735 RepID=K7FYS5_PELSI